MIFKSFIKKYLHLKIIKDLRHYKECRDQQKSRIKQSNGLESVCKYSSKDH